MRTASLVLGIIGGVLAIIFAIVFRAPLKTHRKA